MATVVIVLPLRTTRVARVAARQYLEALADVLAQAVSRLSGGDPSDADLRAAIRRLDVAYQALVATVWPLRTPLLGRPAERIAAFVQAATATRHYASNLVLDTTLSRELDPPDRAELADAGQRLSNSVATLVGRLTEAGADGGSYVPAAPLLDRVAAGLPERELTSPTQLAVRDLQMIDAALAEVARWAGLPVADLDSALA
jgi:uncharacterized membrane protein YccC